jgi:hypothetical protein
VIEVRTKSASSIGLALLLLCAGLCQIHFQPRAQAQQNAPQPVSLKVNTKNIGGAFELTAETLLYGDVKVYLPDDMAAGDTISGTVVAEPKGKTDEERARNQDTLKGFVVEIGGQKVAASDGTFTWTIPQIKEQPRHSFRVIDNSDKEVANVVIPVLLLPPNVPRPQTITPNDFRFPTIGQQGRAVEIFGPFDGDSSNTALNLQGAPSATQDFEKNTENVSGGFGLIRPLAESPRKMVFRSPGEVTGPIELNLKEGNVQTTGTYRNVGVRLSAPKTNLMKGEKTTLTVEVSGLDGIRTGVPLRLDARGVINMDGGNFQNLRINPTDVQPGGRYTTTRAITGQMAGGFSVTATVIVRPFDLCLRDERNPHRALLWNTFNGDYIFTDPGPTGQPRPPGGLNLTGLGKPAMKGCIITLTHNTPDRRVFARLDACSNTGSAEVQTSSPKTNSTITDQNVADNACGAPPK